MGVALTALMRVPPARRAEVHAEALRRLAEARENDYRRYLLLDCLEAYATLDEAQAQELAGALLPDRSALSRGPGPWQITTFEKRSAGGFCRPADNCFRSQLEARFGPLSPSAQERSAPEPERPGAPRPARHAPVAPGIGPGGLIGVARCSTFRYLLLGCLESYATLDEVKQERAARTELPSGGPSRGNDDIEEGFTTRSARLADGASRSSSRPDSVRWIPVPKSRSTAAGPERLGGGAARALLERRGRSRNWAWRINTISTPLYPSRFPFSWDWAAVSLWGEVVSRSCSHPRAPLCATAARFGRCGFRMQDVVLACGGRLGQGNVKWNRPGRGRGSGGRRRRARSVRRRGVAQSVPAAGDDAPPECGVPASR